MAGEFSSLKQLVIALIIIGVVGAAGVMALFRKYLPEVVEKPTPVVNPAENSGKKQTPKPDKSPPLTPQQEAVLIEEGNRLIQEGKYWVEEGKRAIARAEMYEKGKQKSKTPSVKRQDTFASKLRQKGNEYINKGQEMLRKGEALLQEVEERKKKR